MSFCPSCAKVMNLVSQPDLVFICPICGRQIPASDDDIKIKSRQYTSENIVSIFKNPIKYATDDPTNKQVLQECECGMSYATFLRLGSAEKVILKCKCGKITAPTHHEKKDRLVTK